VNNSGGPILSGRRSDSDTTATLSGGTVVAGTPCTLIATINYATATATIYKDGIQIATASGTFLTAGVTSATNSAATQVMHFTAATQPSAADHAHSAIYEYAMDATTVAKLHNWLAAR
jgi:hypothetical protein